LSDDDKMIWQIKLCINLLELCALSVVDLYNVILQTGLCHGLPIFGYKVKANGHLRCESLFNGQLIAHSLFNQIGVYHQETIIANHEFSTWNKMLNPLIDKIIFDLCSLYNVCFSPSIIEKLYV
jgi:hypothetical protein